MEDNQFGEETDYSTFVSQLNRIKITSEDKTIETSEFLNTVDSIINESANYFLERDLEIQNLLQTLEPENSDNLLDSMALIYPCLRYLLLFIKNWVLKRNSHKRKSFQKQPSTRCKIKGLRVWSSLEDPAFHSITI